MKLFVWDFHGVLEQGNDKAVILISNQVLKEAGFRERFLLKDSKALYGLKWHEYFATLLPDATAEQHTALQAACFAYAENNIAIVRDHIRPTPNAGNVLNAIAKAGHDQIVISNSRPQDLVWFLNAVGIAHYFPEAKAFGVNSHEHFSDKISALTNYLHNKPMTEIVIISDSLSDMQLRHAAKSVTYLYSHKATNQSKEYEGVDHCIADLRQLLQEL